MISEDVSASNERNQSPISIGFDAKRAFYNKSGLGNYSRNLLVSLSKKYPWNNYCLFSPKIKSRISFENEGKFRLIQPEWFFFKMFGALWRLKYLNNEIKRSKVEIYHGLSQELPLGIKKTGVRSVVTVHDLIFMRYPEFYKWIDAKIYYLKLLHACRISDVIIAISEQTRKDIIDLLNIPSEKITVIYQGCNQDFWNYSSHEQQEVVRIKYNLPEKYLLYVGTIEERKNLLGLIKALDIKKINIPLVVIGRKTDKYFPKVKRYISEHNLSNIIFPGHILNQDLPEIYQNAECFIYPSLFEGFGIPVLEALVSGTPVITSNGGCFTEAGGPGSLYVDPYNPEEIGDAINRVLNEKDLRESMISAGKNYAIKFNDDIIVKNYMNLYQSLIK